MLRNRWKAAAVLGVFWTICCIRPAAGDVEQAWSKVKQILSGTQDIVVLDGTEKTDLRYAG